jgi:RNA ligase (TIGR02306 family)
MRTLASIRSVNAAKPIPNADAIERVRVLGWWVVTKKGEFRPGDRVVYCEIDSLLPERPEFEFLRASGYKPAQVDGAGQVILPAGFRVKTVKLRGQVSQGICFPLSLLPPGAPTDEGADVTDLLGIRKWEPPLPAGMGGKVKGGLPGFLPETDETRVQVLEGVLRRHRGKTFHVTEKLAGTSFTAFLRDGTFGICSRNLWMDEADPGNVLARVARTLRLEERLRAAREKRGVGGPGRGDRAGTLVLDHTVDALVALSEGASVLNPKAQREGIVLRPPAEEYDEDVGGRLSFKVINPKFLLKYDE